MKRFLTILTTGTLIAAICAAGLFYGSESKPVFGATIVAIADGQLRDDEQLPLRVTGISKRGNASDLTNIQVTVNDPSLGTFEMLATPLPNGTIGYFVAAGPLGTATVTITALNDKGEQLSKVYTIDILAGAAFEIVVEALPAEPNPNL